MSGRSFQAPFLVIAIAFAYHPAALARRPPAQRSARSGAATPIDEFERMSPEQQQRALERLPPAQRQKLQQRLQRFNQLPAEQQRTLRNLYNRLHQLPPEQQESVRKAINRFSEQAPGRQQLMRDELRSMAALPEQDRQARMASQEFRKTLSRREQSILKDMLPVLPGR
jgi:thioesterase domain-containing protein